MIEKELEKKVQKFLDENNRSYYKDSIKYVSLRDVIMPDGSSRKLHVVSFMVSLSDLKYDSDASYSVAFDEKTHKMVFIIGPQSFEEFNE